MKNQATPCRRRVSRRAELILVLGACACLLAAPASAADDAGIVKTSQGEVLIVRDGASLPAPVGTRDAEHDFRLAGQG